jgi:glycine amidinotransferase
MIVNSHNEWDTLEEVILGNGFPSTLPSADITFKLFFHDNIYEQDENGIINKERVTIKKQYIEEMAEDLEEFSQVLKDFGVIVRRPKVPPAVVPIRTPYWSTTNFHCLNVRDLTIIIGDEIIETPVDERYRYYETDYMKHLFYEYFKKGAKWCSKGNLIIWTMDLK